jgi:uncharacterized protein (DUF2147 family)
MPLFLITHLKGLGGEATQYRAGRNLDREAADQSKDDIRRALCYTEEYVKAYVLARGKIPSGVAETMPSARKTALKDEDWWLNPSERALRLNARASGVSVVVAIAACGAYGCGSPTAPDSSEVCSGYADWQSSPYVLP